MIVRRSFTFQSSWTKYSWKCARSWICVCWRSIEKSCTCPSRKLASWMPVVVFPGRSLPSVDEREGAGRRRRLKHVQSLPAIVEPHLQRVASLQPGERVGDFRHAGVEVGRGIGRRAELLVCRRSGTSACVFGNCAVGRDARNVRAPRLPSSAASTALRPTVRRGLADSQLRSGCSTRTCAGSWRRTTTRSCSAVPSVPVGRRRCRRGAASPG